VKNSKTVAGGKPERELSPESEFAGTLTMAPLVSRNGRKSMSIYSLSHPVCDPFGYGSPSRHTHIQGPFQ
jgi:hypothetical protein